MDLSLFGKFMMGVFVFFIFSIFVLIVMVLCKFDDLNNTKDKIQKIENVIHKEYFDQIGKSEEELSELQNSYEKLQETLKFQEKDYNHTILLFVFTIFFIVALIGTEHLRSELEFENKRLENKFEYLSKEVAQIKECQQ